jgi:poly-gamma-glutamate synthesis protein (capsule biosynthesis protein)
VQAEWETFCRRAADAALAHMLGLNIWLTRANRLLAGRLVRALYSRRQRMTTMNFIRCDAHREVVLTALDETLGAPAKGGHRR